MEIYIIYSSPICSVSLENLDSLLLQASDLQSEGSPYLLLPPSPLPSMLLPQ